MLRNLLDRVGAVTGVGTVLLAVVLAHVAPTGGLAAYTALAVTLSLVVFTGAIAVRLVRHAGADWSLLAVVGVSALAVGLLGSQDLLVLLQVVGGALRDHALSAGDLMGAQTDTTAIPLALFLAGTGAAGLRQGSLPRPLCWAALTLAAVCAGAGAGQAAWLGSPVGEGATATLLVVALLGFWGWSVAVGVHLWRVPVAEREPLVRG